jgi:hypothetical protein
MQIPHKASSKPIICSVKLTAISTIGFSNISVSSNSNYILQQFSFINFAGTFKCITNVASLY